MFRQAGFHVVALDKLAELAGYSRGAVYSNFANKDEVMLALIEREMEKRLEALQPATESGRTLEDASLAVALGYMQLYRKDPSWSLLLTEFAAHAARTTKLQSELQRRTQRLRHAIAHLIAATLSRFGLKPDTEACAKAAAAVLLVNAGMAVEKPASAAVGDELIADLYVSIIRRAATESSRH